MIGDITIREWSLLATLGVSLIANAFALATLLWQRDRIRTLQATADAEAMHIAASDRKRGLA